MSEGGSKSAMRIAAESVKGRGWTNSFQNELLQGILEVARLATALPPLYRCLPPNDPRRQPQRMVRHAGKTSDAIVRLRQPHRPAGADAKVEPAANLGRRARLIRASAIAHAVRADRHPEDRNRPLRAHRARLQRDERRERPARHGASAAPANSPSSRSLSPPAAPPDWRRQLGQQTEPAFPPRRREREGAAVGEIAPAAKAGIARSRSRPRPRRSRPAVSRRQGEATARERNGRAEDRTTQPSREQPRIRCPRVARDHLARVRDPEPARGGEEHVAEVDGDGAGRAPR